MSRFSHIISAIDAHTGGEPTRIVLSGFPPIPGTTMADKKGYLREHLDWLRTLLMQEPRGHSDMFGVLLTPPTVASAHYGALFMDNAGYIDMCGHGLISVTTALIETGMLPATEPVTPVVFDTPAGLIESRAVVQDGRVLEVTITNVPSFLYAREVKVELPALGTVTLDVAFGGNFFALVDARTVGVTVQADAVAQLLQLGRQIKAAVNRTCPVQHPVQTHITTVELVEFVEPPEPGRPCARSAVIFGNGQLDRCPCGTGTSAAMARLYGRGELALGANYLNEGIIGTRFRGRLVREVSVRQFAAVVPEVTGSAYLTGLQQFVVDPADPVGYGFLVGR
jgi:proline racemase/trans-L-3-hydroxyproline dehydratase